MFAAEFEGTQVFEGVEIKRKKPEDGALEGKANAQKDFPTAGSVHATGTGLLAHIKFASAE